MSARDEGTARCAAHLAGMKHRGDLWLVVNSASGSNNEQAVNAVRDALAGSIGPVSRIIDVQQQDSPDPGDLAGVAHLAVFAGDGTVNALVGRLSGWPGDVLVLPGGTSNLLARDLHGEAEALEIAAGAGSMPRVRRNAIRTSRGLALVEVLAGPGARWSDVREGLREGSLGDVAASAAEALVQSTTGPMVRIVDPALGREQGYAGVRLSLASHPPEAGFAVEGYGADSAADWLKQGLALVRRNFREGPHDDLGVHRVLGCESADGSPVPLMIDGESADGEPREQFSLAPLGVDLLSSLA